MSNVRAEEVRERERENQNQGKKVKRQMRKGNSNRYIEYIKVPIGTIFFIYIKNSVSFWIRIRMMLDGWVIG